MQIGILFAVGGVLIILGFVNFIIFVSTGIFMFVVGGELEHLLKGSDHNNPHF